MDNIRIKKVIDYACTFIGVPYRWHRDGDSIQPEDKFWASNNAPPTRQQIDEQDKCIVCTGLINLMRRFQGLTIPGLDGSLNDIEGDKFAGTTGIWFEYLARANRLEPLDIKKAYPAGTLVLRNFSSVETDQGHVAVIIDERGPCVLDQTIIHAYAIDDYSSSFDKKNVGTTGTTRFRYSHYFSSETGYYTHVCVPENWLLIN